MSRDIYSDRYPEFLADIKRGEHDARGLNKPTPQLVASVKDIVDDLAAGKVDALAKGVVKDWMDDALAELEWRANS